MKFGIFLNTSPLISYIYKDDLLFSHLQSQRDPVTY